MVLSGHEENITTPEHLTRRGHTEFAMAYVSFAEMEQAESNSIGRALNTGRHYHVRQKDLYPCNFGSKKKPHFNHWRPRNRSNN